MNIIRNICLSSSLLFSLFGYSNQLVISIPKTGTNLLFKCVRLLTKKRLMVNMEEIDKNERKKNKMFFWGHSWKGPLDENRSLGPTPSKVAQIEKHNIKVLITIRDPRELVCSLHRYRGFDIKEIIEKPGYVLNFISGALYDSDDFSEYTNLSDAYADLLEWTKYPFVYMTSFESLVGAQGNGSNLLQIQEIKNIARFLDIKITHDEAIKIGKKLFGGTFSFRKGQINSWKDILSDEELELFYKKEGSLAQSLGY